MEIRNDLENLLDIKADVCIVGSGPVGLALATDLARRGIKVVVLESGTKRPQAESGSLSQPEFLSETTHASLDMSVCRALGGTSWLWGGRCQPLDPIDLEKRAHIPDSGWPISFTDIEDYLQPAAEFLDCGPGIFTVDEIHPHHEVARGSSAVVTSSVERWCNEAQTARRLPSLAATGPISVYLNSTVVELQLDQDGERLNAITVARRDGPRVTFSNANVFVLACGGLETARILLNEQARHPLLFGGVYGPLGRYYMGHLSGRVAEIVYRSRDVARQFGYQRDGKHVFRRKFTISPHELTSKCLPNISVGPENPLLADSSHGSGLLSAIYLLLANPVTGRWLVAEAIRQAQLNDKPYWAGHARNLLVDGIQAVPDLLNLLYQRLVIGRRKPAFFIDSKSLAYPLHYHAEHLSNPESCVRLGESRDALGMRRLRINLQFSSADADGIVRAHRVLERDISSSGLADVRCCYSDGVLHDQILHQARDGFHQIGLTRMGHNSRNSVVDGDCRVFGFNNLYIAGSSVFRTSGRANPTFFAVALALRLSAHLAKAIRLRPKGVAI